MELPRRKKTERGMLEGIKSKLGFADANQGYDDGNYDEGFDDYGDDNYGEYGDYGAAYNEDFGNYDAPPVAPASRYSSFSPATTRSARTASSRGSGFTPPKLVSIDDVRAHTQVPESLQRDPLPPRRITSPSHARSERTMVDASTPTLMNTPKARASMASNRERSESLNSLFKPTTEPVPPASSVTGHAAPASRFSATAPHDSASGLSGTTESFDPYDAYAGSGSGSAWHGPARSLLVLKPASYAEVERIAKALKAGDVVVLALRNTPDNLAKRILDFSFGVSSALDASVDCVAEKVFVITRGAALSDTERTNLRNQGVL